MKKRQWILKSGLALLLLTVPGCSGSSDKADREVKEIEPNTTINAPTGTEQKNPEDAGLNGKFQRQEKPETP